MPLFANAIHGSKPFDFLDRRDFVDDSVGFRVQKQHFIISDVYSVATRELVRSKMTQNCWKKKNYRRTAIQELLYKEFTLEDTCILLYIIS